MFSWPLSSGARGGSGMSEILLGTLRTLPPCQPACEISEAEARASKSEAIPFGETPEQRKREFQEALRKILRVGQDRDSSNKKVWTEALHLLDNPRARVPNYKRPKDSPKR